MKVRYTALVWALILAPYSASQAFDLSNLQGAGGLTGAGAKVLQAAVLSDSDIKALSDKACAQMDRQEKLAPAGSAYEVRFKKISKILGTSINDQSVNYKVYLTKDVNAWAMANGCIRVYSGLMDMMTDAELQGVIGHEMGHVALGHSKKAMQTAYTLSAARDAASATGNSAITALNSSQLGDLAEKFVNNQFSQSQETQADDYSFDLMHAKKLNTRGLVTAFQKLGELEGGKTDMMSSHPPSSKRAQHIEERIAKAK